MQIIKQVKPEVGMSVSYSIGSDSYHQIIMRITRNGKTIETLNADDVLGGLSYENWLATPQSIRLAHINNVLQKTLAFIEEEYERPNPQLRHIFTLCSDGHYRSKGTQSGSLYLNSTHQYFDPSF
jgi:hypothetical protein